MNEFCCVYGLLDPWASVTPLSISTVSAESSLGGVRGFWSIVRYSCCSLRDFDVIGELMLRLCPSLCSGERLSEYDGEEGGNRGSDE